MEKELKTFVVEQSGGLSAMKARQLAQLIEAYAKAHPELLEEFEKLKGQENNGDNDF